MNTELTKLDEHDELPAVISSSYSPNGGCIDTTDTDKVKSYVEICNHVRAALSIQTNSFGNPLEHVLFLLFTHECFLFPYNNSADWFVGD